MLQINSGKLYPNGVGRQNQLRGVLYTNLAIAGLDDKPIETPAGNLLPTDASGSPNALVYELTERMEDGRIAAGVLISHGVQPYLYDFGALVSFVLNVTCTPSFELASRLLSGKRTLGVMTPASKLIKRVFDPVIWCQPADAALLTSFTTDLIGLRRKSFLAVIKAIRTYVTGLHRVAEDVELAYTLLIASIESLAQDFDGHEGRWIDYDESKRKRIDDALRDADTETALRVKTALIEIEHLALSRRFRDFAFHYIDPSYFREGAVDRVGVLGRLDMRDALKEAYQLRSRYVHKLKRLPDHLSIDMSYGEGARVEHRTFLTLEGLARVARHVIMEFVAREPKVETELYDFSLERHGIVRGQLAPEYWIGRPEALAADSGRVWLEGFLQQFAAHLQSGAKMTDLTAALSKVVTMLPTLSEKQRLPFLVLYCLYGQIVPAENQPPNFKEIVWQHQAQIAAPSVESLAAYLLVNVPCGWTLETHQEEHDQYFRQRNGAKGFRAPAVFEAGFTLALAERYRLAGDAEHAQGLLAFAAENSPYFASLRELELQFNPDVPLDWGKALLPART